ELICARNSKHGQTMMSETQHLFVLITREHVGEVADTKAHFGSERCRQQLACDLSHIDCRRWIKTIVAIAAPLGWILAEVTQENSAAAARRLDESRERIEPLSLSCAPLRLNLRFYALTRAGKVFGT